MVSVGYTLMCEQAGPKQLVDHAVRAEAAGFDQLVMSDHYYPWLDSQGHSPYAWSVLGAVAHATSRAQLMSFVTCPIRRYHPAVVAQKASTIGALSDGRFTLGLGAGENLNEHVVGGWPHVQQRHEMFEEALQIIRPLLNGETLTFSGNHFDVPDAYVWDRPERPVPMAVAASGRQSATLAAEYGNGIISTEPDRHIIEMYDDAGVPASPATDRWPSVTAPTRRSAARSCMTSSAGSEWVGRSTPTCPTRRPSPPPPSSSGRRTSPRASPAARTWTCTSRRSASSSTPVSPTWRSSRSAAKPSRCSWTGRRSSCCPGCASCEAHRRALRCHGAAAGDGRSPAGRG
ncbi:TIGR03557 family F420-dependent LLM class oxidoreductase [Micromonospora sp. M12]